MNKYNYTITDIANWFLNKEPMVQRKLQKLCYYSQAWNLAFTGEKLFDNDFEAWAHGPVCRTLWNEFKDYGFNDIESNYYADVAKSIKDKKVKHLLDEIWRVYGCHSAFELESSTHAERPWLEARGDLSELAPSTDILNNDTIRDFYRSFLINTGEGIGE